MTSQDSGSYTKILVFVSKIRVNCIRILMSENGILAFIALLWESFFCHKVQLWLKILIFVLKIRQQSELIFSCRVENFTTVFRPLDAIFCTNKRLGPKIPIFPSKIRVDSRIILEYESRIFPFVSLSPEQKKAFQAENPYYCRGSSDKIL